MPLPVSRPRVLWLLAAVFLVCAGPARAASGWYCEPLKAFYPAVQSCPAPWRSASEASIPSAQAPQAEAVPPAPKPPADPAGQPTFRAPPSLARGDQLDEWCKGMTTAINLAVCSDDELRRLALERLRAFNEADARLSPDRRKVLAADQNGWALSYPQSCGLSAAEPPAVPLAPSVKECLVQAGRKRLAYLRSYGLANSAEAQPAAAASASPPPQAANSPKPETTPPPDSGTSPTASAPLVRIPPTAQNQAATQPPSAEPARPAEKPVSSPVPSAAEKPASNAVPSAVKIGGLVIAVMVVGLWLVSGLRRLRGLRR